MGNISTPVWITQSCVAAICRHVPKYDDLNDWGNDGRRLVCLTAICRLALFGDPCPVLPN